MLYLHLNTHTHTIDSMKSKMDTNESQTGFKEQIGEFSQKKKRKGQRKTRYV